MTETIAPLIAQHRDTPGGLLPLLHAIQAALGHIPPEAVDAIARGLNLSRAEVHGVISFYHHFRTTPPGRRVVQLCRAESCRSCGSEALVAEAEKVLGCRMGETSTGGVTLESVYCLGQCAASPAVALDEQPIARMTPARLHSLLQNLEVTA